MTTLVYANSTSLEIIPSNENHSSVELSVKSDYFIDTFISSNEEGSQNDKSIVVIEKNIDDDNEIKAQKNKEGKKITTIFAFNFLDITFTTFSESKNELPSYSHFEEVFNAWYKLYQVFRI